MTAIIFALAGICTPAQAATASVTGGFVTDPLSGAAIGGYDAISYFTEPEPLVGKPDYEFYWNGVPWYFANEANRDAFAGAPEIYAPQFGGHGTMSMARGYISDGNPSIYAVLDNRLYLFYSPDNRDAFFQADHVARYRALEKWKVLAGTLPRP